jgi:hypothetical protein
MNITLHNQQNCPLFYIVYRAYIEQCLRGKEQILLDLFFMLCNNSDSV